MTRIKELRQIKNIKQIDLARELVILQSTLSHWKNNKFEPDTDSLVRIAEYFGVSVDYLLGKNEKKASPPNDELAQLLQEPLMDEIYRAALRLSPEARRIILAQI